MSNEINKKLREIIQFINEYTKTLNRRDAEKQYWKKEKISEELDELRWIILYLNQGLVTKLKESKTIIFWNGND